MVKSDETLRCDTRLLASVSSFFEDKISGHKRYNEPLKFNYQNFDYSTVKTYLNVVYGIDDAYQLLDTKELLKLLKFLTFEGKSHVSGKV